LVRSRIFGAPAKLGDCFVKSKISTINFFTASESLAQVLADVKHRTANGTLPDTLISPSDQAKLVAFLESIEFTTAPIAAGPPTPPNLNLVLLGTGLRLSWLTNASDYTLTSNTNLKSGNWAIVTPPPVIQGSNYVVTNSISSAAMYYRLRKP